MRTILTFYQCDKCGAKLPIRKLAVEHKKTEWISVKERLPEDDISVLVCDIDSHVFTAILCYGGEWREDGEYCECDEITHWMPLPEPYSQIKSAEV